MPRIERRVILDRLRAKIRDGRAIVGGGAGTGLSAKCEEAGGIDLIVIYNSGRYRMAGRGSLAGLLAFGNANEIVVDMAKEVLPVVKNTPVLAGVNGTDPFVDFDRFLDQLKDIGFSGIQNFPTIGIMDGIFRANLEETDLGFAKEIDLVRLANQKDMLTTPYAFTIDEGVEMVKAGADLLVCHMGLTTGGSIGADSGKSLEQSATLINEMCEAALKVRRDVIVLCHGGPIAAPADAEYILSNCPDCHGFYGASSMERLPTETALTQQTEKFMKIRRSA